ncbi:HEAT repeat domain-containing protein [Isoptericola sp. NPDC019693]|uniref:HEAT repeat domain-containing protein n=1 Tax=Isoptericola sp. NPDC019693 TaxID=3364009 RepID=UPI0037B37176
MTETKGARYRAELRALAPDRVPGYLDARSGLPGPRANLELLDAFGDVAPPGLVRTLVDDADEYLRSCATAALGRLLVDADGAPADTLATLHARATDRSWRVREAVAMALQRVGDHDPRALRTLVAAWVADPHPLVRRAAVAGVCEPRLLRDPRTASAALDACRAASGTIEALPAGARRDPDVRTLRQALGYCWSVAVAADPVRGLPEFAALEASTDPDLAWVARENRKKARLRRVLPSGPGD